MEVTSFFFTRGSMGSLVPALLPLIHLLRSLSAAAELQEAHQAFAEHMKATLLVR